MELNKNTFVAILAGGIGSRFWPASREDRPKQFLDITNCGKSLLQLTFDRFKHICPENQIYIVTNEQYVPLVQEQLPQVHADQIIGEPGRNNTAPCVAYTAFKIHAQNEQANLIVAPSDHLIMQEFAFIKTIEEALSFSASNDALVTLGIQPVRPDTGYGYIQKMQTPIEGNVYKVLRFAEKPPLNTAKEYVESGDYLWNAGKFILFYMPEQTFITPVPKMLSSKKNIQKRLLFPLIMRLWKKRIMFLHCLVIGVGPIWVPGHLCMLNLRKTVKGM